MLKHITLLVILLVAASSQSTTCGVTSLTNIASKTLTLAPGANGFVQKQYNETLGSSLGISAVIHTAFAIAGFQGSCTQTSFSLGVDTVIFENSNSRMRFTMNYDHNGFTSQWTRVKLNYLLVSDKFSSWPTSASNLGANYVWAGSVQFTPTRSGDYGLYGEGSIFSNPTGALQAACGYLSNAPSTSTAKFDCTCPSNNNAIIPHYYIMGFQFAPGSVTLGAMAKIPNYLTKISIDVTFGTTNATGWGPIVKYDQFGGSLKKLKVAIVITILQSTSPYPNTIQGFTYSGVYNLMDIENIYRPLTQPTAKLAATGSYNRQRYQMARLSYGIYGLASFTLNQAAGCSAIDIDVEIKDINNIIVRTDNTDALTDVIVAGDFYSGTNLNTCGSGTTVIPSRTMTNIPTKFYSTVPTMSPSNQDISLTTNSPPTYRLSASSMVNGSSTVTFNITMNYENFVVGNTYAITLTIDKLGTNWLTGAFPNNPVKYIKWTTQVDGRTIYDVNITGATSNTDAAQLADNWGAGAIGAIGLTIKSATPTVRFFVTIPRPVADTPLTNGGPKDFVASIAILIQQYTTVYIPATDCCDTKCPDGSGINLRSNPPSCIVCSGDSNLNYDAKTGICDCKAGFYNIAPVSSGNKICFPCLAKLCGVCDINNPANCTSCANGAALNINNICQCTAGFYESNGSCLACPAKCNGCQVGGVCSACSDPQRRLDQNCDCPAGLYDDGGSTCKTCNPLCKTCTNSSACTSCFSENNRTLVNGQCVCSSGFYQVVQNDNTVVCRRCSPECKQCSGPNVCLDCDASLNRIIGYDEQGHLTCYCRPGFSSTRGGPCIQNGCVADPFCQQCDDARGVTVCVQCIASSNRVLALPQYKCVCRQGFYDDNGNCKPCSSGCAKCSNATSCQRCAVSATNNNNGTCACPQSYFFAVDPLRYCKRCKPYCLRCQAQNTCDLCLPGFSATSNGQCICARGKYVNSNLQCVPCINNCTVCGGEDNCTLCNAGYFLQDRKCVTRCNIGYYISGVVCEKCQDGCSHCERAGTCLVCEAGRFAYNGLCYVNCPAGSIAQVTNMTCLQCNTPCGNCTQHPSKCLTCLTGNFFEFGCVDSCPVGTYSNNRTCTYCSFECAACLGSPSTCIACPDGQYLFEGKCYAKCPIPLVNGRCPNLCPAGFFTQPGSGNCLKCNDRCRSCDGAADRCTSCASGFASNGACVSACPANTVNINGNCRPCAEGCNGCQNAVDQCSTCQSGYFLVGNKCVASCDAGFFRDGNNGCKKCPDTCTSCTSATSCTACVQTRNQPINGVCYKCIYPCSDCTSYEQCTACISGFNVVNGRCTSQCPAGSTASNGVCRCTTGVFYNGRCTPSCPSGWTNIDGSCQQCDSSCASCSGDVKTCTTCKTGYILNAVTGVCDVNRNCNFGEYFSSESNICKRICPAGYSYQDSLCVSDCLSGFRDNGFGGCISQGIVTGCSFPYFYQQGSCVSTCSAGSYPNVATRVCQACSSNCYSCLSSAFCTSCSSGFDLKNNICIAGQRCANNKLKYNGVCLDSCPAGTIVSNGYCERRCDPNHYFLDGRCYPSCPTGFPLRTDVACVVQCPTGYILDRSVCKLSVQTCPSGQFYNAQNGVCTACSYPCTQCQYTSNYCSACPAGFTLTSNRCSQSNSCGSGRFRTSSGACATCPSKCTDCVSATDCSTCASGYVYNGADCVLRVSNLRQLQITQSAISRRLNTVFITIRASIIPNGLSAEQQNGFFLVASSENAKVNRINQWISASDSNTLIVAVEYASFPTSSTLFIAVNARILSSSLENVGYSASENSYIAVSINNGIANAPSTLVIPASATNNIETKLERISTNSAVQKAIRSTILDKTFIN